MIIIGNIMEPRFEIIHKDWYKRRKPVKNLVEPISVEIPDYQATKNHMCKMKVVYSDRSEKQLIARVLFNEKTQQWTVDGMEVAVKVHHE